MKTLQNCYEFTDRKAPTYPRTVWIYATSVVDCCANNKDVYDTSVSAQMYIDDGCII